MNLPPYKFIDTLTYLPFVKTLYLFGSRARGDNFPKSDIDLAIEFTNDDSYNRNAVTGIVEYADTLLKIDWVDITNKKENDFLRAIQSEWVKLYERCN